MTDFEKEMCKKHGKITTAVLRRAKSTEAVYRCGGMRVALEWELTCKRILGKMAYEQSRLPEHMNELKSIMAEADTEL